MNWYSFSLSQEKQVKVKYVFIDGTTSTEFKTTVSTTTVLIQTPTSTSTKTKASSSYELTGWQKLLLMAKITTTTSKTTKTANTGKALAKTPLLWIKQKVLKLLIGTEVSWKWGPPKKGSRCGAIVKADCNHQQCCSTSEWCGSTAEHCCDSCTDFRGIKVIENTTGQNSPGEESLFYFGRNCRF